MKIIVCRNDYPLSGDAAIDRQRYRRGQVIDCLPAGAAVGEAILRHPFMQVIDVPDLTVEDAARLCMTDYQSWRGGLDDAFFANPHDPRRVDDDPMLYARRRVRIDLDHATLPAAERSRLAVHGEHRATARLTRAQVMDAVRDDERARSPLRVLAR